jgi:myo-inositol catabolism protein IolS
MKFVKLGNTNINVSVIALGTWVMGGDTGWGSNHDDQRYVDTIRVAIEHGINTIDTARGYGNGHSEEIVGKAIKGKAGLYISTKAEAEYLVPENAEKSVEASLKRLGVDYIDIFYIHWPKPGISVARNMEALEALRRKGLIKYIGVSNFTVRHMDIARNAGTIDVFQPPYSLLWRNIESNLLPYCIKNSIGVMTYSSIAMGLLSGKYTKDSTFEDGDIRKEYVPLFKDDIYYKSLEAVEKLKVIVKKYDVTVVQAAINWVFNQQGIAAAIVGARTPKQLEENLKAADFTISDEDLRYMSTVCDEVKEAVADWDSMYWKKANLLEIKE